MENYIGNNTFAGPKGVMVHQLLVLANALQLYGEHKIRVDRHTTPKRMIEMAEKSTGKRFGRKYLEASIACKAKADELCVEVKAEMVVNRTSR